MNEQQRGSKPQMQSRPPGRDDRANRPNEQPRSSPPIAIDQILNGSPEETDAAARHIAQDCRSLARSQMRNFFGPIVRLRAELTNPAFDPRRCARDLYMHSARVTYMAARDANAQPLERSFKSLVQKAVANSAIESAKLRSICDFAEAIVAYHYPLSR